MSKRSLALLWPVLLPKLRSVEVQFEQKEWNQEEEKFRLGVQEPQESAREKVERLMPNIGDLKRLVL